MCVQIPSLCVFGSTASIYRALQCQAVNSINTTFVSVEPFHSEPVYAFYCSNVVSKIIAAAKIYSSIVNVGEDKSSIEAPRHNSNGVH